MENEKFTLLSVGYDFMTLTSFDRELLYVARDIAQTRNNYGSIGEHKRHMGYTGRQIDGMFFGSRNQLVSGTWTEHFMVQLWGQNTLKRATIFPDFIDDLRCTRLDVQGTMLTNCTEPLRDTYDEAIKAGLGAKLVEQKKATVYFGSRKSQRYIRLYEKDGKDRDEFRELSRIEPEDRVIRFEVEFKADLSEVGFRNILEQNDDAFLLVYGELGRKWVPTRVMNGFLNEFKDKALKNRAYYLRGARKQTDPYRFFTETILPWLLNRKDKLEGQELQAVEQWIQAKFDIDG